MATSLIGGLIASGYPPAQLIAADPSAERLAAIGSEYGIKTSMDNHATAAQADVVVFAVKPQVLRDAAHQVANELANRNPLIISIAAGVRMTDLEQWLGYDAALVRTMPNTPALVGSGVTALWANPRVSAEARELAETILRSVGSTLWVESEPLLDAVTAVSGSGPAYFFLMMEALEEAAQQAGLSPEAARLLTIETAFGAAKMALSGETDPATLRQRVTSPGGTTERAINEFEAGGLRSLFIRAVDAAKKRSEELAIQLGNSHG